MERGAVSKTGSRIGTQMQHQDPGSGSLGKRRRTRIVSEKKIADDEFMAAAIGDVEWLRQSLKDQEEEIHFDKKGYGAIHLAAIHGRLECLKLCIEKSKVNVNSPSATGWRAVHLCISNQTGKRAIQCLEYLLQKGADPSVANDDGITPMHQAASEGHVECLKLLISVGAKIDGCDCRGNTPLDLAKLWAHRMCGRLLAAEMWQRNKEHVAKEMQQLRNLKMKQVLEEIEKGEEFKSAQKIYGDIAFNDWLKKHNVKDTSDDYQPNDKMTPIKQKTVHCGAMKPNSHSDEVKKTLTTSSKVASPAAKSPAGSYLLSHHPRVQLDTEEQTEVGTEAQVIPVSKRMSRKKNRPPVVNPVIWKKYAHLPPKSYVTNLKDAYPRDPFTGMPKVKGAHRFYSGKHAHKTQFTIEDLEKARAANSQFPELPVEMINKEMSKDPTLDERPIVFKPQHIYDVDRKLLCPLDKKPVSEIALHLMDDPRSQLLYLSLTPVEAARLVAQGIGGQEWLLDEQMGVALAQGLRQMARPATFPDLPQSEYQGKFSGHRQGV